MKCYKITIHQNSYSIASSRKLMLKLMRETLKEFPKLPHKEMGVMYEEVSTFPKIYYFNTDNKALLMKVIESCKAVEVDCPPYPDPDRLFQFLGNKAFFMSRSCERCYPTITNKNPCTEVHWQRTSVQGFLF